MHCAHQARSLGRPDASRCARSTRTPTWCAQCFDYLRSKGLKTVSPEEASKLVESGEWVLVDVRKSDQHAAAAPKGAVSVPMYKQLSLTGSDGGFDFSKLLKSAMYAFNGVVSWRLRPGRGAAAQRGAHAAAQSTDATH